MFSQRNNPYCAFLSRATVIIKKQQNNAETLKSNISYLNIFIELIKYTNSMKHILGLDLGTNSIGWALIQQNFENKQGEILGMGSRIIPMDQKILGDFGAGNSISQTAERTGYRGVRRLRERHLLRRERLHRILHLLGFLPEHYDAQIDFTKRFGKFLNGTEPKLAYANNSFLFQESFYEMLEEFKKSQPEFLKNKNGKDGLIPYDWTLYYLRKKALTQKIEKEELA